MRALPHILLALGSLLASGSLVPAQEKFELRPDRPGAHPLFTAPAAPMHSARPPAQPTPDPNLLDLTRTIQNSPLKARGIVGRIDERKGINFEAGNVRTAATHEHQTSHEMERAGIIGVLVFFGIAGCWWLSPRRKKSRRRRRQQQLERARTPSRFSY